MILVINAQDVEAANAWMKETIDPEGGEYTFTLPLYFEGEIKYYWCSILLTSDQLSDMQIFFAPLIFDSKPSEVLTALGVSTENTLSS